MKDIAIELSAQEIERVLRSLMHQRGRLPDNSQARGEITEIIEKINKARGSFAYDLGRAYPLTPDSAANE